MVKNYLKLMLAIVLTSQAMAQVIPSNVSKDGLVGWWPFNGNANDESGNGNHGTVNGATLTFDRFGRSNCAYSFDGIDDYIQCNVKKIPLNNSNRTISLWCNLNSFPSPGQGYYFASYGSYQAYSYQGNSIGISNNSPILTFRYSGYGHPGTYIDYAQEVEIKKWYNLVGIIEDGKVKLFINGILVSSANSSGWNTIFSDFFIGRLVSYDDFTDGYLDDIAIYNRALSEQEIKQLYEGCPRETATLNPTNGVVLKNSNPVTLSATPSGGVFKGKAILNGDFTPKNATLGSNSVDYHFVNSQGCKDSTQFKVVVYDTLGTVCSSTDTLKIKFQLTTGIKAGQLTAMNVYPNPTSDVLFIEASDVNALKNYTYRIVNLEGKEVYKNFVTATKTEISLKTLGSKGIYVLHILDENGTSIENKKIVLE